MLVFLRMNAAFDCFSYTGGIDGKSRNYLSNYGNASSEIRRATNSESGLAPPLCLIRRLQRALSRSRQTLVLKSDDSKFPEIASLDIEERC